MEILMNYLFETYAPDHMVRHLTGCGVASVVISLPLPLVIGGIFKLTKRRFKPIFFYAIIFTSLPVWGMTIAGRDFNKKLHTSNQTVQEQKQPAGPSEKSLAVDNEEKIRKMIMLSGAMEPFRRHLVDATAAWLEELIKNSPPLPEELLNGAKSTYVSTTTDVIYGKDGVFFIYMEAVSKYFTESQINRIIDFYENPLYAKIQSREGVTDQDKKEYEDLRERVFDNDIQTAYDQVLQEVVKHNAQWGHRMTMAAEAGLNKYFAKFNYSIKDNKIIRNE
jgi:hypothetical protein